MNINLKKQIEELERERNENMDGFGKATLHRIIGELNALKRFEKLIEELKKAFNWEGASIKIDKIFYSEEEDD